uniref:Uncharacterized protein n=1 Tax=Arundo donax TaxID=35708 RepID=A0A0A9EFL9_ARUDO
MNIISGTIYFQINKSPIKGEWMNYSQ